MRSPASRQTRDRSRQGMRRQPRDSAHRLARSAYLSGGGVVKDLDASTGWSVGLLLAVALRVGARGYFGPRPWGLWWAGEEMFDGVIPLGGALRPLDLSRPSTRVACRQQSSGSRPRRIGVSEGLPRAKVWMFVFGGSGLAGTRCHTAQPKPGSSGEGIGARGGCRRFGGAWAAA